MFESLVSEILTKYLGKFVKGLDKENLKIAVWGGDVVLENLEIRASALAHLNLPFAVKSGTPPPNKERTALFFSIGLTQQMMECAGFLGELRLKIPWSNIRSGLLNDPIVIILRRIYLIAVSNNQYVSRQSIHSF